MPSMVRVREADGVVPDDMVFVVADWLKQVEICCDRSIGVGKGSNEGPAHFTLTFAALDRILTTFAGREGEADEPSHLRLDRMRKQPMHIGSSQGAT